MCELITTKRKDPSGKGFHVDIVCATTGKPPTVTNQYGMFCEDLCDMQKSIDLMEGINTGSMAQDFAILFNRKFGEMFGHPACRPNMVHAKPCGPVPGDDMMCACGCSADEIYCMELPEHERR